MGFLITCQNHLIVNDHSYPTVSEITAITLFCYIFQKIYFEQKCLSLYFCSANIIFYIFRPVNCEICGKEFSNNNNLTRHIQTTHDKKFVVQVRYYFSCKTICCYRN